MSGITIPLATILPVLAIQTSQSSAANHPGTNKAAKPQPRLVEVLREWEQAMREVREYRYTLTWTRTDTTFGQQPSESHSALVYVSRPERLRVEVRDATGQAEFTVLCADSQTRVYDFRKRKFYDASPCQSPAAIPRPGRPIAGLEFPTWLQGGIDEMRWIVLGFPVSQLAEKFTMELQKEDENWTYLGLTAKSHGWWCPPSDWQIVLARHGRWVRRCTRYNGGDVTILDFTQPRIGRNPPAAWDPPFDKLPSGWTTPPWGLLRQRRPLADSAAR